MQPREIFRRMDVLLHEWHDDPDTTTAEFLCVQFDELVAAYLKRPAFVHHPDDEDDA